MPTSKTLYVWATPAFADGSPVDHTWVTSFDNRAGNYPDIAAVVAAKEDYWYCWGDYHAKGGTPNNPSGFLGSQGGDVDLSVCLVQSNAECASTYAARGTIFTYGVDGVCHQLANQALYSTGAAGGTLTVAKARGYLVSSAIYGTYGLQQAAWRNKVVACSGATTSARGRRAKAGTKMRAKPIAPSPDEFEERVAKVLGPDRVSLAAQLLHLRAQFHTTAALQAHATHVPAAEELNERNQRFLDDAAKILPAKDYEKIFGVKPGEKIRLVRPEMMTPTGEERRSRRGR